MSMFEDSNLSPDEFLELEKEPVEAPVGSLGLKLKEAFDNKQEIPAPLKKQIEKSIDRRDYLEKMKDFIIKTVESGKDVVVIHWSSWFSNFTDGEGRFHDYVNEYLKGREYYFTGVGTLLTREDAKKLVVLRMLSKYSKSRVQEFRDNAIRNEELRLRMIETRQANKSKWINRYLSATGTYPEKEEIDNYIPPELYKKVYSSILYIRPWKSGYASASTRLFDDMPQRVSIIEIIDQLNT
jgi:hypothetical protein